MDDNGSKPRNCALPELGRELTELVHAQRHGTQDCVRMIGDYASRQLTLAITFLVQEHDRIVKEQHATIKRLKDQLALGQFIDPSFVSSDDTNAADVPIGAIEERHRPESFRLASPRHGKSAAGVTNEIDWFFDQPKNDAQPRQSIAQQMKDADNDLDIVYGSAPARDNARTASFSRRMSPFSQTSQVGSSARQISAQPRESIAQQRKDADNDLDIVYGSASSRDNVRNASFSRRLSPFSQTSQVGSFTRQISPSSTKSSNRSSYLVAPLELPAPSMVKEPAGSPPQLLLPEAAVPVRGVDKAVPSDEMFFPDSHSMIGGRDESLSPGGELSLSSANQWNLSGEVLQAAPSNRNSGLLDRRETETLQPSKRRCWEMDAERLAALSLRHASCKQASFIAKSRNLTDLDTLISLEHQGVGAAADKCVLHPQSRQRLVWDVLAMIFLMYDLTVVPLHVFELPPSTEIYTLDLLTLVYWSMDMVASFFTGVYSNGQLILRVRHIAPIYLRRWFAFDCLIIIPEWFVALSQLGQSSAESPVGLARVFRSSRFVRILRFLRLLRLMKVDKVLRDLKGRINNNACLLFISLIRLTLGVVVLIHCLACAWYALGKLSPDGWIFAEDIAGKPLGERYLFSFQFAMARLHPSSYDKNMTLVTVPERIFAIVTSLLALAGCGAFVSSVTNTMAQLQSFRQQRIKKLFIVREYVQYYNISVQLSTRVQKYIEKSITRKLREQHANELSAMLPLTLLLDLRFEAWTPFMAPQDFFGEFKDNHPRTVWCLGKEALHEVSVVASETVFYLGDPCSRVLFPNSGKVAYVSGHHQRDVPSGAAISEAVLWTPWENKGELCAYVDSTLLALLAKEFIRTVLENERAMLDTVQRCDLVVGWMRTNPDLVTDLLPKELTESRIGQKSCRDSLTSMSSQCRNSGVVPVSEGFNSDW